MGSTAEVNGTVYFTVILSIILVFGPVSPGGSGRCGARYLDNPLSLSVCSGSFHPGDTHASYHFTILAFGERFPPLPETIFLMAGEPGR